LGDKVGDAKQGFTDVAAGETAEFGPFSGTVRFNVASSIGSASWSVSAADYPAVRSGDFERIVKCSQSEYDLLSPPDPATLYMIVG
jgi:hypothetical protein